MNIVTRYIRLKTKGNTDVIDLTDDVLTNLEESGIQNGIVVLFVPGSTGALSTIEYESGAISDIKDIMEKLVPRNYDYKHNYTWNDGNGHSHIRATIIGPSLSIPVVQGELTLGTWQQIVFIDFDTRERRREIVMQIVGE